MSSTVWIEQVDIALRDFISKHIHVDYEKLDVRVRKPDEDFKTEDYPLISFYNVYSRRDDFRRFNNGLVPVSRDTETNTMVLENPSLPYNLFYQIDFWSQKQMHMNSMTMQWLMLTGGGKDFNLPVIDTGGTSRSCYCLCTDDLKKADLLDGTNRTFHSFITYRIYVEIDENIQTVVPMVTKVQPKVVKEG